MNIKYTKLSNEILFIKLVINGKVIIYINKGKW